jgi:hypothetical protein
LQPVRAKPARRAAALRMAILFINTFPFTTKRRTTQNVTRFLLSNHDFTSIVTNGNEKKHDAWFNATFFMTLKCT